MQFKKLVLIRVLFLTLSIFCSGLVAAQAISCTETDNTAQQGSFTTGYNATFETLGDGTSVKITFELLDTDKEGVVAFLWKQSPFTETQMAGSGNNVFSETVTGLANGQVITYACKFAFAGGLAVTKYINYEVGDVCNPDPVQDATLSDIKVDRVSIEGFSPEQTKYKVTYEEGTTTRPEVSATATQPGATITYSTDSSLPGTTTIEVTAENGVNTKTYSVVFQEELILVWADEFDADGALNTNNWHHQTFAPFGGSWANGEIQHYTDRTSNSIVENGVLKIIGRKEPGYTQDGSTKDYTSARLNSKFAFTYGRVDISAKMPPENGTWPALWLLGKNINETGAYWQTQGFGTTTWPVCGEIDIMEQFTDKNSIAAAIHTPVSFGGTENKGDIVANTSTTEFHLYSIIWTEEEIQFLYDDEVYYTYNPTTRYGIKDTNPSSGVMNWPFDLPQYLILNVALGGLVGNPDPDFTSATMEVDYVRVYQTKSSILTFDDFSFEVDENSANGTSVGSALASYAGTGTLSYGITAGNEDGIFQIDEATGAISVADGSKLDFETRPSYSLTVEVTDGTVTDSAIVTVTIGDIQENPLSIGEEPVFQYIVYPNPVSDVLTLTLDRPEGIKRVGVVDLIGKAIEVPLVSHQSGEYQLDFTHVNPGIYVLRVEGADGIQQIKIQKR